MTVELAMFISMVAMLFNFISLWAVTRLKNDQIEVAKKTWKRINYLEVAMSYHGMVPMPWENENLEDHVEEIKAFKQEGNVVYLQKEE
tara:strand:- start:238 stop:501 length:264 start_codon:yes stop_codon:yes gene_type:complete